MALNVCAGCTTRFAVGLKRCPHCGSKDFQEEGTMPKITAHGGASDATLPVPETETAAVDVPAPEAEPLDATEPMTQEGGEEPSAGSNSETSTETPQPSSEPSEQSSQSPARTTASRSKKARTGSSSARSTAGGQETGTSAADD